MKVLHVVEDYSIESGGLRTVIKDLNKYLNKADDFQSFILSSKKEALDNVFIVETTKPWLYSKEWVNKLKDIYEQHRFDICHIHGVWLYPQYISAKFCIKNKIPFILSCHGMYEPWLWEKGSFKKKFYFNYLAKNVFEKANVIHTITPQENRNLKLLFKHNKTIEIPNLIIIPDVVQLEETKKEKYLLYLGRLDQKKGIDILIEAFSEVKNENVKLKIAGKINSYKASLDELINRLKIESKVDFLGIVSGQQKENLINNAHVLIAPSHSEVIGMVNLEGAILKTPVITTYQTGLNPEWSNNGGKLINPNLQELSKALKEVLKWDNKKRKQNGEKLYDFVTINYSWEEKINDWLKLYKSCKIEKH
jgi:glycosyltransferase involved in cell wall biosynthesis